MTNKVYQIKVSLDGSTPPIWRRLLVSEDANLQQLHDIIQVAMGWFESHLHQFIADGVFYGVPDEEFDLKDESQHTISELLNQEMQEIKYEYDFGDSWMHTITLEKILSNDDNGGHLPRCIEGERAAPPEDCGGIPGYENLLKILSDPENPQHDEMHEWLAIDEFDSAYFDMEDVNDELLDL